MLTKVDIFGKPIPSFNVGGKEKVTTVFGGMVTVAIMVFAVGYFASKLRSVIEQDNPILN